MCVRVKTVDSIYDFIFKELNIKSISDEAGEFDLDVPGEVFVHINGMWDITFFDKDTDYPITLVLSDFTLDIKQ